MNSDQKDIKTKRWLSFPLVLWGCWTLFGLFFACQAYLNNAYFGRPVPFRRTLIVWLSCAYIWALLTPLVIYIARRFSFEKRMYLRGLIIHLLAGALFSIVQLAIYTFVRQLLLGVPSQPFSPLKSFQNILVAEFHSNLLIYWSIIGLFYAYDYYRRFRERERRAAQLELEASQLETQLARAQLDALRMQLHPHFLFNTLNTISVLMKEDTTVADRMLLRLSDLLRLALKNTNAHEVPLRQELEFLRSYLEIEQTRFQDRLQVMMKIDPDALEALVPNLILQPLVENAIRHAVAPRAGAGTIEIQASRCDGHVELQVRDDGDGMDEASGLNTQGIGLSNTRARLYKLYGAAHRFQLSPAERGGLQVLVRIPFHTGEGREENSDEDNPRSHS